MWPRNGISKPEHGLHFLNFNFDDVENIYSHFGNDENIRISEYRDMNF